MNLPLITYATAKLAKKRGYEVNTASFYYNNGKLITYPNVRHDFNPNHTCDRYSAPTQESLKYWLRKEKNIAITMGIDTNNSTYYANIWLISEIDEFNFIFSTKADKIYEVALENGLFHVLETMDFKNFFSKTHY